MTEEEVQLLAHGPPNADETKKAAFKQMTSAFRFAYTAWEFAALGKSILAIGSFASYALKNIEEACRVLNCNEAVLIEKMQGLSDWLESKGLVGIRALVRTDVGHLVVETKTSGQLVGQMRQFRESYFVLLAQNAEHNEESRR